MPNTMSLNILTKFKTINKEELEQSLYSALQGSYNKFIVIDEDIMLEELNLDALNSFVDVIIINANLKVDGGIINTNGDYGVALIVTGDVQVEYIIAGGSEIYLQGKTSVESFIVGHYNDGILSVSDIEVPIELNCDHHSEVYGSIKYEFNLYDDEDDIETFSKCFNYEALFIETEIDEGNDEEYYVIDIDEVIKIICNDEERSVFYRTILKCLDEDNPD